MNSGTSISLVVPIFNEEKYLPLFFKSILKQTALPDEIVLVNNCSFDNSDNQIRDFILNNRKLNIKHVNEQQKGVKYAREKGWKTATKNIVIMSDADTQFPDNYIAYIKSEFEDSTCKVLTGRYEFIELPTIFHWIIQPIWNFYMKYLFKLVRGYRLCIGGVTAYHRSVFIQVGGYLDNHFTENEDEYFSKKLRYFNIPVRYKEDFYVFHSTRRYEQEGIIGLIKWGLSSNTYKEKTK